MKNKLIIIILFVVFILVSASVYFVLTNSHYERNAGGVESSEAVESNLSESGTETKADSDVKSESSDDMAQTDIYDGTAPVIHKMNDPLIINSFIGENEQERLKAVYDKGLIYCGWSGKMKFTITGATMYNTFEETGIDDEVANFMPDTIEGDMPKYIVLNIDIENISASIPTSDQSDTFLINYLLETNNEFSQENFKEVFTRTNMYNSLHYFSLHGKGNKDYYSFTLPQGSTVSAQMGFYVSQHALLESQELILCIGYSSSIRAFGIELNDIVDYTKGVDESVVTSKS